MTMINLALMTAEGLGKRLAPELSLTDAALPYLAEALGVSVPPRAAVHGTTEPPRRQKPELHPSVWKWIFLDSPIPRRARSLAMQLAPRKIS